MNTPKPIQIFKPGTHTAMNGASLSFSESDLAASAAAYDPALHEAPIVVGHPKADAPAYGWVKSLSYSEGLDAEPHQVDAEFAEMVKAGRFKKVSASFYTPDAKANPVPGVYYLRHVGFLGAQPPSVKGLKQVEFADSEQGIVEFGDWDDRNNAGLWRGLRDWLIGKFGIDEADKALPSWNVQALSDSAAQPETDDLAGSPGFSEPNPQPKGDEMSAEEKARLAALEAENAKLKQDAANFAEAQATSARAARHADHLAFAEGLVKEGKLLPAQKDVAAATLDFMADQDQVVEFGEGDAKKPLLQAFKEFMQALPKQVDFGEHAGGALPTVDLTDPTALHQKAVEFMEAEAKAGRTINIAEAVASVASRMAD